VHERGGSQVTFTIVAVLLLIVANILLVKLLLGAVGHPSNLVELLDHLEPVNAASFRHLASYSDDHYLRANLPRKEYLRLKHLRLKAVHGYYLCALRNSSLLLAYGEVLAGSPHRTFVEFGSEIRRTSDAGCPRAPRHTKAAAMSCAERTNNIRGPPSDADVSAANILSGVSLREGSDH